MIRGTDDMGAIFVVLTKAEMQRLLAGERICSNPRLPHAPGPHLCLFGAEDDVAGAERLCQAYPDTQPDVPTADYRGDPTAQKHPEREK